MWKGRLRKVDPHEAYFRCSGTSTLSPDVGRKKSSTYCALILLEQWKQGEKSQPGYLRSVIHQILEQCPEALLVMLRESRVESYSRAVRDD